MFLAELLLWLQEELKNCSTNENTEKSTGVWLSVWKKWCMEKKVTDEVENYEPAELNTLSICTPKWKYR